MTDQETRDTFASAGRRALALEALVVALVQDRIADLGANERTAKLLDLAGYADAHIEAADIVGEGQPRPEHDMARKVAHEMVRDVLSRFE